MSNSPLVTYKRITSNRNSPREDKIDTITIHCYVGQVTAKKGCDYFATTDREVSANYVVGYDGSIGLSVEEKDRAWTSYSPSNDHRAVTIEVACDPFEPYAVTDKAYKALIELVADICQRNNIKELKWKADKSLIGQIDKQNMTVHRWFMATDCPGEWLYSRMGEIASKVNAKIKPVTTTKPTTSTQTTNNNTTLYRVQVGAYSQETGAKKLLNDVKKAGFTDAFIVKEGKYFKVQAGAFSKKPNADTRLKEMKKAGFTDAFIKTITSTASTTKTETKKEIKVGSTVRIKKGSLTYDGKSLASFVFNRNHKVSEINGNRVVVTYNGEIVAAVKKSALTLIF